MSTIQPTAWFEARIGQTVNRNGKTFAIPNNNKAVSYCVSLQEKGFKFSEVQKPKPRVHVTQSVCESCEG